MTTLAARPTPGTTVPEALICELDALLHTNLAGCLDAAEHALRDDDAGALAACDRTASIAIELERPVWRARSLECRGLVHHGVDDDEQAIDLLREAVELCRRAGDDAATAKSLTVLGRTYAAYPPFAARTNIRGAVAAARRAPAAARLAVATVAERVRVRVESA